MKNKSLEYLQQCRAALNNEQAKSLSETQNWSHVDKQKVHEDWDVLYKKLTPLIGQFDARSDEVQEMISAHYEIVSRFYKPSKKAYIGMALFYKEDQEMKKFHDAYHPDLVDFLGDAMCCYAENNL